jgi:hypothetical protein
MDTPALGRFVPAAVRAALRGEWADGHPSEVFASLAAALADLMADLRTAGATGGTLAACLLAALAAVVSAGHRPDVARALARRLRADCDLAPAQALLFDDVVFATFAELQCYRQGLALPADLADAPADLLSVVGQTVLAALHDLPGALWHTAALGARRETHDGGLTVVVPPGERDAAAPFPGELVAATPPDAAVIDAWAERLSPDETVAAVRATRPRLVAIAWDREDAAEALAARLTGTRLGAVCPRSVDSAWLAARPFLATAAAGPPYPSLALLLGAGDGAVLTADAPCRFALPDSWPLAGYRRRDEAADVVLPVEGRSGARLAAELADLTAAMPNALVRLDDGLTPEQAEELLETLPRPLPADWSLTIAEPHLPADPGDLRRAGVGQALLRIGPDHVPAAFASVVAETLAAARIEVRVVAGDGA